MSKVLPEHAEEIRTLHGQGLSWPRVASVMNISESCARRNGARLGLHSNYATQSVCKDGTKIVRPPTVRPENTKHTLPPLPSLQMPMPVIKGR
jgi:hypothetical protein